MQTLDASAIVGRNVLAELARRREPQASLAAYVGISPSQMSKRLNGVIPIDVNELTRIAEFLDMPLTALLPADLAVSA